MIIEIGRRASSIISGDGFAQTYLRAPVIFI
jgi:hypothetical protein